MTTIPYKNRAGDWCDYPQSFTPEDLQLLAAFLKGRDTFTMFEVAMGANGIAVRHDVDHSLAHAVAFAKWEREQGIRSTYFVLPTAYYWSEKPALQMYLDAIAGFGHEIGIHNNALTQAYWDTPGAFKDDIEGLEPLAQKMLNDSIEELRGYGHTVRGVAAHGSEAGFNNIAVWERWNLKDFGLVYEAYLLNEGCNYISDNRGKWRADLEHIQGKPTRLLVHPEHWNLVDRREENA